MVREVLCGAVLSVAVAGAASASESSPFDQAVDAIRDGRFAEAECVLRQHVADPTAPVVGEYAVLLETMRRIRLDYSLTSEAMLTKLRQSIPDATAADVERWRADGSLQHREIDGAVWFFKREPSNLFRFCKEAKDRRAPREPTRAGVAFDLPQHLAHLVKAADAVGRSEVFPVKHHVTYRLAVKPGHPRLKPGAKVRCWLPFPQEYRQQKDVRLVSTKPDGAVIAPNGHPQRTICFERTVAAADEAVEFVAEFEFVTSAYVPKLDPAQVKPYDQTAELYREYTAQRPPHIVFTPEISQVAREVVAGETNPLERARKLYRWICENVSYCAEMEYCTIPSIPGKAMETRRGDCGVQGLLFVTLCRAAGVPARWQSGWESLPNRANMHDWAEFYVEPWGWLPADPSYGMQDHADPRVREFYCGHLDPYRMIVNLDYSRDLTPGKVSWRSEPNDFQRGEIEIGGHNLYFGEWTWDFDVRTTPLEGGLVAVQEALDAVVPALLEAGGMSGAVLGVGRRVGDRYETWRKAYGYSQTMPRVVSMLDDAVFDLASMTKPIATGSSMMVLVDRGQVGLGDRVGRYLPEFEVGAKRSDTVRHLMTHMSGMKPYIHGKAQAELKAEHGYPCPQALRTHIRQADLACNPGEAVSYSCLNAILCAEIVETVSGSPLDEFAAEHVFRPLGMRDTGFNPPERLWPRCVPTTPAERGRGQGGFLTGQVHDPLAAMQGGVSGNAGLFSTVADLHRFAQMVLNGGELDGVRVLSADAVRMMTTVRNPGAKNVKGHPDRRGLLWDIYYPDAGDTGVDALFAFGHTGYTGTAIRFYPEQGVYVIALANRVHPDDSGEVGAFRREIWRTVGESLMGVSDRERTLSTPRGG